MGGLNIVIDVFSGSIHAVDDVTYDIIESFEKKSREELLAEVAAKFADVDSAEIASTTTTVTVEKALDATSDSVEVYSLN